MHRFLYGLKFWLSCETLTAFYVNKMRKKDVEIKWEGRRNFSNFHSVGRSLLIADGGENLEKTHMIPLYN